MPQGGRLSVPSHRAPLSSSSQAPEIDTQSGEAEKLYRMAAVGPRENASKAGCGLGSGAAAVAAESRGRRRRA